MRPETLCSQACAGLGTHLFVPSTDDLRARRKAIANVPVFVSTVCASTCPVRGECLHYGIATGSSGWWGGHLLHEGGPVDPTGHVGGDAQRRLAAAAPGSRPAFLAAALTADTDECILWPFDTGRPIVRLDGRNQHVTAVMATITHGCRPSPSHQTHQTCGQPSCVNPRHIIWRKAQSPSQRLDADKVRLIRQLHAEGTTQTALAKRFGVAMQTINYVVRRITWTEVE